MRAQRLETEVRTLENLLQSGAGGLWAPVVESMTVAKGYETALGAALGDDLVRWLLRLRAADWLKAPLSAGELIAEGVLAIEMGATAADLKLTIHPHPTLSETVMESAEVFFGQATHVYKPKKK